MSQIHVKSVLLWGAVGSGSQSNEGIAERVVAKHAETVMAFDVVDVGPQPWAFIVADGRDMPFRDQQFDLIVANAGIKHVGDWKDQARFVAEHSRVGRNRIITTSSRWFPVESHTSVVFRHWLGGWRAEKAGFTRLLSRKEFSDLLPVGARIVGRPWSPTFTAYSA